MSAPRRSAGNSLVELLVVIVILGILSSMGVPRMRYAFETARVDEACGVLFTIWSAERMYWMEEREYTKKFDELIAYRLVDSALPDLEEPFEYTIRKANDDSFKARAKREGSDWYKGDLEIEENADITGEIEDDDGRIFTPID